VRLGELGDLVNERLPSLVVLGKLALEEIDGDEDNDVSLD